MFNKDKAKVAVVTLVAGTTALLSPSVQAAPVLFAVTTNDRVAETLPYGPAAPNPAGPAFFSNATANLTHNVWTQEAFNASNTLLYSITWQFADTKTMQDRFVNAVNVGESVTWTVTAPSIVGSQVIVGTWRFSSTAGAIGTRFSGSGANFSADDGAWGAGTNVNGATGASLTTTAWGHGAWNTNDSSDTLRLNNVSSAPAAGFRNLMFVNDGAPEIHAATAAAPLAVLTCLLLCLSDSKRRRLTP